MEIVHIEYQRYRGTTLVNQGWAICSGSSKRSVRTWLFSGDLLSHKSLPQSCPPRSHLDMLDRELPAANSENQQPKNQRGGGALVEERLSREQQRVQRPEPYDERAFEIGVRQANLYLFTLFVKNRC